MTHLEDNYLNQAKASLQQALSWYSSFRRHWNYPPNPELQAAVKKDLQALKTALDKLEQRVIRIATFGLVSRGKSAVINALVGEKVLATGPLHGVTQWPRSICWKPTTGKIQIELIDTPGLDEIEGEARAKMAREVAYQADLILFVVAGDITRTEYQALCELRESQKPILLVFNKIDLYPEKDRLEIYQQLQRLGVGKQNQQMLEILSPAEIVMVAAEPQPILLRQEWPDGRIQEEWVTPAPQIEDLKAKLLTVLNREGRSLLALNALFQARDAERNIAHKTRELRSPEADELIWNYAKYKALAIAINPVGFLDLMGSFIVDLALIRALAKLYGLPITSYQAGRIWRVIISSAGGLFLGEIFSSLILGFGKSAAAIGGMFESPTAFTLYSSAAMIQGSLAAYGAYAVGKAAQVYLENGCSWGANGPSTLIREILQQVNSDTLIYRLRHTNSDN